MTDKCEWRPIDQPPPHGVRVWIKTPSATFQGAYWHNVSMTSEEEECDQWQAHNEDECPLCWTDGCCWEVNAELEASEQPVGWLYLHER